MKRLIITALVIAAILCSLPAFGAGYTLLHEFAGGPDDGYGPHDSLTLSGSTLYGMAQYGGDDNCGTVFQINTDGTGQTLLHEFAGGTDDGRQPKGSLILSGSTLYGMTLIGGNYGRGVVFKINTDGTGHTILHEFAGGADDGADSYGTLTLSGSTLYGTTDFGGDNDGGVVFKVNTDGSGYSNLHEFAGEFAGGADDGCRPHRGSLVLSGSTLYGTTEIGGDNNDGVVYKLNTDGSGFGLLHEFVGGADDGEIPYGSVVLSGSTLYGTTGLGGDNSCGVVFKVNTDGSGFGLLHEFAGGADDGRGPSSSLTLSGSTLYGTTTYGGDDNCGTVFQINTDGTGHTLLHEFAGGGDDGKWPPGSLSLSGSTLYGMTEGGGDYDKGVVFSLDIPTVVPEPSTLLLLAPGLLGIAGFAFRKRR